LTRRGSTARIPSQARHQVAAQVLLPPHCTSFLQVHDTHVNRTFKAEFRRAKLDRDIENARLKKAGEAVVVYTRELFAVDVVVALARTPVTLVRDGVTKNIFDPLRQAQFPRHIHRPPAAAREHLRSSANEGGPEDRGKAEGHEEGRQEKDDGQVWVIHRD
jgi:hypothetical protein